MRKRFYWKLPEGELALGETTLVAAVLPIGNDPAPDGERYVDHDRVYGRALQMEEAGAALLELVPETLRAGQPVTGEEEQLHRMVPVLKRLKGQVTVPVVVRTSRAVVAERAIEHGAAVIYDPSGLTAGDAVLAKAVATAKAGLIVGQMRGGPEGWAKQWK